MDFLIGGLAAMGATFFSNPLDVLKTRIQLQGELKPRGQHEIHYRHALHTAYVVIRKEGIFALQKGLGAALFMHGVRNSIKLGSYQWFANQGYIYDSENKTIFYKSLLASAFGGTAGAFFGSPLYQITTQLQSHAAKGIAVGHQHKHSGLLQAFKAIYSKHGVKGLWRGSSANILRTVVGASAQLTTFSEAKDTLRQYEFFQKSTTMTALFASIAGGICQTVFQTPLDLVCIRLNNQYVYTNGQGALYTGMTNCFTKILQSEGLCGLYKGVGVNYMRIARHTGLCLVFWELLKDLHVTYFTLNNNVKCNISNEIIKL
ncbi:solute carrier family 25 member 35-like [Tribolium madens]|uniref:solute carrier family 25 member 35-like n=1 Tax=Tribolium madens TaxID=41895 RepID=UPI001CF75B93|nr:solute carrier family 25 member 35-like [Tribolium madens]XP_044272024.1 solute carrier family 25 member 35-like [Tribolium madens]XP_044272025.1 solute carrier family 25 member 35-like [Tribolium madens]XP_044272026.1 solute carrier family 25 member 35-like [Tribolium madens]XP_044272027.1 solute carrier family 25 member 35-like [Tribolium madens]